MMPEFVKEIMKFTCREEDEEKKGRKPAETKKTEAKKSEPKKALKRTPEEEKAAKEYPPSTSVERRKNSRRECARRPVWSSSSTCRSSLRT